MPDRADVMTATEAAEYMRVSLATMTKLLNEGVIPAVKLGRGWRISREVLERYIKTGKTE